MTSSRSCSRRHRPVVDFRANTIRWRGDQDKIGHEHVTSMVQAAWNALLKERRLRATTEDNDQWVFTTPGNPSQPKLRHLARDRWDRTGKAAGIARVPGRGWHSDPEAMRVALEKRGVLRNGRAP